jgi:hypothetical protein
MHLCLPLPSLGCLSAAQSGRRAAFALKEGKCRTTGPARGQQEGCLPTSHAPHAAAAAAAAAAAGAALPVSPTSTSPKQHRAVVPLASRVEAECFLAADSSNAVGTPQKVAAKEGR